jgi:transglutaminase-like putative cysteine protease
LIYSVRHSTCFRYEPAVRESVMEVRMQPRSEGVQRCLSFQLDVNPVANVTQYRDFAGNMVHHFDIAEAHKRLTITAQSTVELQTGKDPGGRGAGDWRELDAVVAAEDHWEMLLASEFAQPTEALGRLAAELKCERRERPLQLLMELNEGIYNSFRYVPNSTKVDSPIDEALKARQGVCQDFAHIMIALVRGLQVPARYVSGYLAHREPDEEDSDLLLIEQRKDRSMDGASHAWVEALVPRLGWVAFDPTNNLVGGNRHIRVAVGRDYADVPPTRGVYKGEAQSELSVAVTVSSSDAVPVEEPAASVFIRSRPVLARARQRVEQEQQQQ